MTALGDLVGVELGPTSWIEVTQERIDAFAAATDDPQWIHVDPERAADGPFGTTIRPRLSDALALRPDALRGARRPRRNDGRELRHEPRSLPGAGAVGLQIAVGSACRGRGRSRGCVRRSKRRSSARRDEAGLRRRARRPHSLLTTCRWRRRTCLLPWRAGETQAPSRDGRARGRCFARSRLRGTRGELRRDSDGVQWRGPGDMRHRHDRAAVLADRAAPGR